MVESEKVSQRKTKHEPTNVNFTITQDHRGVWRYEKGIQINRLTIASEKMPELNFLAGSTKASETSQTYTLARNDTFLLALAIVKFLSFSSPFLGLYAELRAGPALWMNNVQV